MSLAGVKEYLNKWDRAKDVIELDVLSSTVELAAQALDVIPARIAKTLSFRSGDSCILIVTAGDVKIDNGKFRKQFGFKARMLTAEEVKMMTGHEVGGVCPFAIADPDIQVYTDVSMQRFETLFPACGSNNSAIELTLDELYRYSASAGWIDVCKPITIESLQEVKN